MLSSLGLTDSFLFVVKLPEQYRHRYWIQVTNDEMMHMRKNMRESVSLSICSVGNRRDVYSWPKKKGGPKPTPQYLKFFPAFQPSRTECKNEGETALEENHEQKLA